MRKRNLKLLLELGELPFYIAAESSPSRQDFPKQLPFVLACESDLGLLVQMPLEQTEQALEIVYRNKAPLGTPMLVNGLGRRYADNWVEFINRRVGPDGLRGRTLLEVGSGTGYLLTLLEQMGAKVVGVEPGPAGYALPQNSGIVVLHDYLENCSFDTSFDFVVHFTVAEHMADPVSFFLDQRKLLGPKGQILVAVPDCTDLYERGDLSFLAHEHWSYFTSSSLRMLAQRTGFVQKHCEKSSFGGLLYCQWEIDNFTDRAMPPLDQFAGFQKQAETGVAALHYYFDSHLSAGDTVGVFCPARLQNYYSMLDIKGKRIRFFDDDPNLTGRYYPPIEVAIETRSALLANPVDTVLIFSRAFGGSIGASLREHPELRMIPMTPIADLF